MIPRSTLVVSLLAFASAAAPTLAHAQGAAPISQAEYRQRRDSLLARVGDDAIVLALGAREPAQDYLSFNQASSFNYLTGFQEPDAALVLVKRGAATTATLFVLPRDPAREVWTGARLGTEGVTRATGLAARPAAELRPVLDSLLGTELPLVVIGDVGGNDDVLTPDEQLVDALRRAHPDAAVRVGNGVVEQLRGHKSAAELALIRKAVEITVAAQREAMRAIQPGMNEFELQALIEYTFRRRGAERPSFSTIVGSGPNSTTLHYNRDDRFLGDSDVVVMDIGAAARGYAADVTRTIPVRGTFTPAQREVYQLVRDAQAAAERQATLGAAARLMSDSATAVLAAGLARLGLIESPDATYDCSADGKRSCPQYRLYYMHGLGHGIGLDVHDPDQFYFTGRIEPGSAFTIEPGVYVRANLLDVLPATPRNRALAAKIGAAVKRYANVGVRIEDDYLATEQGVEWISRAPRELSEVEALLHEPRAQAPEARRAEWTTWYR